MASRPRAATKTHFKPKGSGVGQRRVAEFREIVGKVVVLLSSRNISVTQEGTQAYVKFNKVTSLPEVINLPYIPEDADEELLSAIRGFLDHEVAHVLETDPRVKDDPRLIDPTSGKFNKSLDSLMQILEDTRIERKMKVKFPGSLANLSATTRFVAERFTKPALDEAIASSNAAQMFGVLVVPLMRSWSGEQVSTDIMDELGGWDLIAPAISMLEPFKDRVRELGTTGDALDLACDIFKALKAPPAPKEEKPEEGEGEESSDTPDTSEGEKGEKSKKPSKKKEKKEKKEKKDNKEDGEEEASEEEGGDNEDEGNQEDGSGESEDEGNQEDGSGESEGTEEDEGEDEGDQGDEGEDEGDQGDEGEDEGDQGDEGEDGESEDAEEEEGEGEDESEGADSSGDSGDSDESGDEVEESSEADSERTEVIESIIDGFAEVKDDVTSNVINMVSKVGAASASYLPYSIQQDEWVKVPLNERDMTTYDSRIVKWDSEMRHMAGTMQSHMRRMFAQQSVSMNIGGKRSGRLQSSALHKLSVNDSRVFYQREEHQALDTAVSLVIDFSGSMDGRKVETACKAAYILSQTLERLGIAHTISGFTTRHDDTTYELYTKVSIETSIIGRSFTRFEPILIYKVKGFDEKFNVNVKRSMVAAAGDDERGSNSSVGLNNNIDGESIAMISRPLLARPEPRKIMIVLSDGFPCCSGDNRALSEHLHSTIENLEKSGVETLGIGICDSSVRGYYKKSAVIHNIDELPVAVMSELKKFLIDNKRST
jgi:cobalamin biosynthesis protein CobT